MLVKRAHLPATPSDVQSKALWPRWRLLALTFLKRLRALLARWPVIDLRALALKALWPLINLRTLALPGTLAYSRTLAYSGTLAYSRTLAYSGTLAL